MLTANTLNEEESSFHVSESPLAISKMKKKSLIIGILLHSSVRSCCGIFFHQICETGEIESITRDQDGRIAFVHSSNGTDNESTQDNFSNKTSGRQLRHSSYSVPAIRIHSKRYLQQESNDTEIFVRPCMCKSNQQGVDILLCPADADFCGIPFSEEDHVTCYSVSVREVVARNAWPLILLWYFGLSLMCCCTMHGAATKQYIKSWFTSQPNEQFIERILSEEDPSTSPRNQWSWWTWQRYRFEQNLLAQAQWNWRNQELQRNQRLGEQGVPPPQLEMKTKRYTLGLDLEGARTEQKVPEDDDDSLQLPTCAICFVPFEEGDRVGALECQHDFHSDCLKSWLSRKNACPLCSQPAARRRPGQRHIVERYLHEQPPIASRGSSDVERSHVGGN